MLQVLAVCSAIALALALWKVYTVLVAITTHGHVLPSVPAAMAGWLCELDVMQPYFVTSHGLALYVRKWLPRADVKPPGVVFIAHGLGEHGGRYEHVARVLVDKHGLAVFSIDFQGHGLSDGERMYARKLMHLAEDLNEFVDHVLSADCAVEPHESVDWASLPRFLFGHSMGGVVALQVAELSLAKAPQRDWSGVILSAPGIFCAGKADGSYPAILPMLARLLPKLKLPPIPFQQLGNDAGVYTRWLRDPLRPDHGATIALSISVVTEGARFGTKGGSPLTTEGFPWPLYMMHGESDTLTLAQGSAAFLNLAKIADENSERVGDKTLRLIPGAVHELLNLAGHDEVLAGMTEWIECHLRVV